MEQPDKAQNQLYQLMSDISQDAYYAGWMIGNEYRLWAMLTEPGDSRVYGRTEVTDKQIAGMRRLSELAGVWIEYVLREGDNIPSEFPLTSNLSP